MVITHTIKLFLLISLILYSSVCFPFGFWIEQHRDCVFVTDLKMKSSLSLEIFPVAQLLKHCTSNAKVYVIQGNKIIF